MQTPSFSRSLKVLVALVSVLSLSVASCLAQREKSTSDAPNQSVTNRVPEKVYPVPRPPWSDDLIFPCSQCHSKMQPPNLTIRPMTEYHQQIVLRHAASMRWCTDCHNPDNRDKLRLISGELIDFTESYRLCGQCHGDKFRDWKAGVHGKRTGNWNGDKQYLLCVHCHNPHSPKFKQLKPMPPPIRPGVARH